MRSIIGRKRASLLIFLLVTLLVLPLNYMGCKGKAGMGPAAEMGEEVAVQPGLSLSKTPQSAELAVALQTEIAELKTRSDEISKARLTKLEVLEAERESLQNELQPLDDQLVALRKEFSDLQQEKEQEEAEAQAENLVTKIGFVAMETKPNASNPKYEAWKAALGAIGAILGTPFGGPYWFAKDLEKDKIAITEAQRMGWGNQPTAEYPLKVKFCKEPHKTHQEGVTEAEPSSSLCTDYDSVTGHYDSELHILYFTENDIKDFKVNKTDMDNIEVCAGEALPFDLRIGGVQIVYGTSNMEENLREVLYATPFYNDFLTAGHCMNFSWKHDLVAFFESRTRNKIRDSGKACTKNSVEGHLRVNFDFNPASRDFEDRKVENFQSKAWVNEDDAKIVVMQPRGPSNFMFKGQEGLSAITLKAKPPYFGDKGRPRYKVHLAGDICFDCAWCSDRFKFSIASVKDLVEAGKSGKAPKCYKHYHGGNYTFKRGYRDRGWYNTAQEDCSFIFEKYIGNGIAEEGYFLPEKAYREPYKEAISKPTPEEPRPDILVQAEDLVASTQSLLDQLGEAVIGVKPSGTFISVTDEKLNEVKAMDREGMDVAEQECVNNEEAVWSDRVIEFWLASLRATIAMRRAQIPLLSAQIKYLKDGELGDTEAGLAEVGPQMDIIKAEVNASEELFNTECGPTCCDPTAVLRLPTVDETPEQEAAEAQEEPAPEQPEQEEVPEQPAEQKEPAQ